MNYLYVFGRHSALALCFLFLPACAMTSTAPNFNGLKNFDGSDAPVHINMTKVAVHLGIVLPFIGDATLDGAVEEFTKAAKQAGANRVRIVQSDETTLWWIFPPFSLILTPKFTNVAGDALTQPPKWCSAPLTP